MNSRTSQVKRSPKRRPLRVSPPLILALRAFVHVVSSVWLIYVYQQALGGSLPGDPVQYLLDFTGIGALHLLMLSLLVSPFAQYLKFSQLMRIRKTLGVYAAIYALFHLYVFIAYELQYEWLLVLEEIIKRPYITVGMLAVVILSSLLLTSLEYFKKAMGKQWQKLHNFAYVAVLLGCIHYLWSVKSDWYEPTLYLSFALFLLLLRKDKIKKIFK